MDRREIQSKKNYKELSEEDKEKDRKFARIILSNLPKTNDKKTTVADVLLYEQGLIE
jgi:hypothetical protein